MVKITLPVDRAVTDMAAVANAFGISIGDLEDDIAVGIISQWFEVGEGDEDNKPHHIFASAKLGVRVEVDESGNVRSTSNYEPVDAVVQPHPVHPARYADVDRGQGTMEEIMDPFVQDDADTARRARLETLLDEALDESFPASDPIAVSFDPPARRATSSKKSDGG